MKTWLMLLLLGLTINIQAQSLQVQDGVIVHKVGGTYLYIFPAAQGRLQASDTPAGVIDVGSIKVMYALKIIKNGKARFIGLDGSALPDKIASQLKPVLTTKMMYEQFGFLIKNSIQPNMHIHIMPGFMGETHKATQEELMQMHEKVARQGNLTVILGATKAGGYRIISAILD